MTDVRLLKRQIPKLTFVEFLNDVFNVKLTKLSKNVRSFGLKNILQKITDDNEIYGMIVVDDFDGVVQYFYESLESVLDLVQFIIDLIKSKEFSIYDVELGDEEVYVIILESDFTFDEVDIMKSLDELEEGTNE
jgi:disulfide oxidoreductase YuzD